MFLSLQIKNKTEPMSNTCNTKENPRSWREYLRSRDFYKTLIAVAVGGIGGFLYYYFIGCTSGTCAITSNPFASIAFGSLFGYFLSNRPCAC
jgi:hypothetical protein